MNKISSIVTKILAKSEPIANILQTLTKEELNLVEAVLIKMKDAENIEILAKKGYPQALASKNIEANMERMKAAPSKYPGGKAQAVAIGISEAKAGKKEPGLHKEEELEKEHLGFDKLKAKLAHKPGITDPAGLAYKIGAAKYGKKGMAEKAAAGKAHKSEDGAKEAAKEKIWEMEEREHGTKDPKKLVEDEKKEHAAKEKKVKKAEQPSGEADYYQKLITNKEGTPNHDHHDELVKYSKEGQWSLEKKYLSVPKKDPMAPKTPSAVGEKAIDYSKGNAPAPKTIDYSKFNTPKKTNPEAAPKISYAGKNVSYTPAPKIEEI